MEPTKYITQLINNKLGHVPQFWFMLQLDADYQQKIQKINDILSSSVNLHTSSALIDDDKRNHYAQNCIDGALALNECLCYLLASSFLDFSIEGNVTFHNDGLIDNMYSQATCNYRINDYQTYFKASCGFEEDRISSAQEHDDMEFSVVTSDRNFMYYLLDNCQRVLNVSPMFLYFIKEINMIKKKHVDNMIHRGNDAAEVKYVSMAIDAPGLEEIVNIFNEYCVLNNVVRSEIL